MNALPPYWWKAQAIRLAAINLFVALGILCISMNAALKVSDEQRLSLVLSIFLFSSLMLLTLAALLLRFEKDIPPEASNGFLKWLLSESSADATIVGIIFGVGAALASAFGLLAAFGVLPWLATYNPEFIVAITGVSLLLGMVVSGVYRRLNKRVR